MFPSDGQGGRSRGGRTWCRILALLLMSGIGCSGCYQPAVVPPTASIPHPLGRPMTEPPSPFDSSPRFTVPPRESVLPAIPAWKPDVPPRDWKYIVLHHTATDSGDVASIHEAHLKNKDKGGKPWLGIGYHFVIGNGNGMDDGEVQPTFRWREQLHGAHAGVGDYNQHGIGIVLIGNFEKHAPSPGQMLAVKQLVATLAADYGVSSDRVLGHGDVKATECPGKHFPLNEVRAAVASRVQAPPTFSRN